MRTYSLYVIYSIGLSLSVSISRGESLLHALASAAVRLISRLALVPFTYIYTHRYIYIYIYIYTHIYVSMYICIHIYICIPVYIHTRLRMCVRVYICVFVCVRVNIYIFAYTHTRVCIHELAAAQERVRRPRSSPHHNTSKQHSRPRQAPARTLTHCCSVPFKHTHESCHTLPELNLQIEVRHSSPWQSQMKPRNVAPGHRRLGHTEVHVK